MPKITPYPEFMADERRKRSRELDFGVWWRGEQNYPTYRVSWIADTGELYAVDSNEAKAELLATIPTEAEVEKKLDGWAPKCGPIASLDWVRFAVGAFNIANPEQIKLFFVCKRCILEKPKGVSPSEWARINAGWTQKGLQVWCVRHNLNIINIDLQGQKVLVDDRV